MRVSNLLWLSIAVAAPGLGQAGILDSLWKSGKEENASTDNKNSVASSDRSNNSSPKTGRRFLHDMIHEERRHVLFNSRQLSGECVSICEPDEGRTDEPEPTRPPGPRTESPTPDPRTRPPSPGTGGETPPTDDPTSSPTKSPTNDPTSSPTDAPTSSPTKSPTSSPTVPSTSSPTAICEQSFKNLGEGFSEATGNPHFEGCYPGITNLNANNLPGRDDSVAVFAGGNFMGVNAAEVEGKVVVLGSLTVESAGPGNFVSVGLGSHVIPNSGGDCIIVGGDLKAEKNIQVFNQSPDMKCDIVYKGSAVDSDRWKTNGEVRHDPNYDLREYETMKFVLGRKSMFWKTLPSTGTVEEKWSTTTFKCSDNDDIQVFNIYPSDFNVFDKATSYQFQKNCEGKTILINVHGSGNIGIKAAAMYDFDGRKGYSPGQFSTCFTESILWNFPDADTVDIGNGATSEFHGSLLVTGNLIMSTTGHSGRTMVLGDIIHDRGGSEFHSYQFAPPFALPDPENICDIPTFAPTTMAPTKAPTNAPTMDLNGCKALPQEVLTPLGKWATNDNECKKCENGYKWWPCDAGLCGGGGCKGEHFGGGDPTPAPTNAGNGNSNLPNGCKAIPQNALPNNKWATNDNECKKCENGYKWWPCNAELCHGKGCKGDHFD